MRRSTFLKAALVAGMVVYLGHSGALAEEKIIKIGTLFPLTGPVATAGQRCQAAVETAVEVVNNNIDQINVQLGLP